MGGPPPFGRKCIPSVQTMPEVHGGTRMGIYSPLLRRHNGGLEGQGGLEGGIDMGYEYETRQQG
jgi:hypothetical protein